MVGCLKSSPRQEVSLDGSVFFPDGLIRMELPSIEDPKDPFGGSFFLHPWELLQLPHSPLSVFFLSINSRFSARAPGRVDQICGDVWVLFTDLPPSEKEYGPLCPPPLSVAETPFFSLWKPPDNLFDE